MSFLFLYFSIPLYFVLKDIFLCAILINLTYFTISFIISIFSCFLVLREKGEEKREIKNFDVRVRHPLAVSYAYPNLELNP